jgi:hypothetical protein
MAGKEQLRVTGALHFLFTGRILLSRPRRFQLVALAAELLDRQFRNSSNTICPHVCGHRHEFRPRGC